MDALLGSLIDLLFGGFGRLVWRMLRAVGLAGEEFSDGGYEALGFVAFALLALGLFMLWGMIALG
ncbi:MAG TPA: hypothetical protein VGJ72_12335 [Polaromonas sp.]|jgi:hypothetical protein